MRGLIKSLEVVRSVAALLRGMAYIAWRSAFGKPPFAHLFDTRVTLVSFMALFGVTNLIFMLIRFPVILALVVAVLSWTLIVGFFWWLSSYANAPGQSSKALISAACAAMAGYDCLDIFLSLSIGDSLLQVLLIQAARCASLFFLYSSFKKLPQYIQSPGYGANEPKDFRS